MDTATRHHEQQLFFATGRRQGEGVDAVDGLALRPALLARYRQLTHLRYDFPLVLVDRGPGAGTIRPLSSIVDEVLQELAPRGIGGERLRKHVLRLEREVRTLLAGSATGTLSELWDMAARKLALPDDPSAGTVLTHIAQKLQLDGDVVDCDRDMPARVLAHAWQAAQQRKAKAFRTLAERLMVKLSDILRAAFIHSEAGQQPAALRASLGGTHRDVFDFAVMSRLVARNAPKDELPASRRSRIAWALGILQSQPFFPDPRLAERRESPAAFDFRFDNCAAAATAYRERLPMVANVVKALSVAELEVDGAYDEAKHDPFFAHFDDSALASDDIAMFPDYLVCIPLERNDAPENAGLMDILSAGLPVKVLVEASDLLEEAPVGTGHFAFGVRSTRLANTATGLGGVFVVQTTSSNLHALGEPLARAFAHRGAGLISVYAGAGATGELPLYLTAAAAMESRAFPAFTYDPYAGDNIAARFSLEDNPLPAADWPVEHFEYADERQQRVIEETPFTVADFVLCDPRYAAHFARVPRERWNALMIPADEWLARAPKAVGDAVPFVLAIDAEDRLQRVIVDARMMQMVARCRTFWHRLQEQGGVHNSHAEILLAREKTKWELAKAGELDALKASVAASVSTSASTSTSTSVSASDAGASATPAAAADSAAAATASEPELPARNPDEAWIDTARCPSCNECQTINDKMFKYNENKQAYIADVRAGTFRQMVEAAEVCQVSIIHPGKPWNPNEPGLPELLERAATFL